MEKLIGEYSVVEIPEDAKDLILDMGYLIFKIMDMDPKKWTTDAEIERDVKLFLKTGKSKFSELPDDYSMWITSGLPLPPGNYELIGISDEITEEQAEKIAEVAVHMEDYEELVKDGWWNYETGGLGAFSTALESFQSLLTSKGLTKRYAIIKKLK